MTHIPSIVAGTKPDTPEAINLFKESVKVLTKKDAPNF